MVLSPIKEESELIEKIYLKYIELQSITQVVNWLQDNKYKGKNGGEWVTTQVQRILSSPLYVKSSTKTHSYIKSLGINVFGEANGNGYLTYNKTRKMVIDRDITEWIYATAKHPGIIDDDKWLMVQTILTKNKHKKVKRLGTGSSNSALLTGILKCSKCGSNMIIKQGHKSKKEEGKRYDYYVCSKKDNSRGKKCDNKNIRTDRLDNIVIGQVNAYNKETLYSNLSKLLEESKDDTNINNKLSSIKLEIKENETKISNLIKQLSSAPNEIVSGYIMQEVSKLSAEINKLKSELENIKEDKKTYNYDLENLKLIVKMLKEFEENFEITDDITKKRLMIQTILNDVTWNGETLEAKITMFGEDKKKL
nr:recombinase family protein [uncultured Clostridium sp.]